ncbi:MULTISPECIES: cupin domain-containing protein [Bacillus cereus group]|uniref:Methyltransferase n=1 Tax=Bacillus cereus TaxID=1396 RepID=A0AA44QBN8_BACCE|nr:MULTISPECIES: cupin domain-containing protein [Bacillus cereus group]PFN10018.1 methyltransferase [Bacillus cereus]PFO79878.1 methyltransferase [Bacillus cereus]PFS01940.1 methyltransferase [Bacillus cereus]
MFVAKKITAEEAQQLSVDTWEAWVGEPNKGTWHVEAQEVFYVTDGEVFITVDRKKYHITKGWIVSLAKDLVCEWDCPAFLKKNYKMNYEINLK